MGLFQPCSKGPWWSREFQAACIESYRAVEEQRYSWIDLQRHVQNVPRFAEESEHKAFPSEVQIRAWAKKYPNLPEEVRDKGFLAGLKPLEAVTNKQLPTMPMKPEAPMVQTLVTPSTGGLMCLCNSWPSCGFQILMQQMVNLMVFTCMALFFSSYLRALLN
jgi:hypothetical protein